MVLRAEGDAARAAALGLDGLVAVDLAAVAREVVEGRAMGLEAGILEVLPGVDGVAAVMGEVASEGEERAEGGAVAAERGLKRRGKLPGS